MSVESNLPKCQVFTPNNMAKKILDNVNYKQDISNKHILENSCGNGNILAEIVKRYIKDSLKNNISFLDIRHGLETYIHGYDIDNECCITTMQKLDKIASHYKILNVNWDIVNADFLHDFCAKNINTRFDYIVGNPPYINYKELSIATRTFLKTSFQSCSKGKFDYCYAFIEASLKLLAQDGQLVYIVPNSILKNVFGIELRNIMKPYIREIIDYTGENVFKNVLISPIVFVCENSETTNNLSYKNLSTKMTLNINKSNLNDKWIFSPQKHEVQKVKFSDLFHASISIATLYNDAFVFQENAITKSDTDYFIVSNYKIERSSVRKCASPRSKTYNKNLYIIFPYKTDENNSVVKFKSVKDFRTFFPRTAEYLSSFKEKLLARDADKAANWFEYGRSQALKNIGQPKLLLSTIITQKVMVYELDTNTVPYSGIFITAQNGNDLKQAKQILESSEFLNYVQEIGISANGSSKRITVRDINNYIL